MTAKTTWIALGTALITGVFANFDRVMEYFEAAGIGIPVSQLAQAKQQITLWEEHVGMKPVDIITVKLPKNRIVQCQPYPDGDTLVVSQTADGEAKSVWVPLERLDAQSVVPTAFAAAPRLYIVRVCSTAQVFHKAAGRNVIMQVLLKSNGRCYAQLIDPARRGKVLSRVPVRCPRGCE
jgi:hypothetical protein